MDNDNYYLHDALEENTKDKIYIQISEPTNGAKYIVEGNKFIYLSDTGWEMDVVHRKRNRERR